MKPCTANHADLSPIQSQFWDVLVKPHVVIDLRFSHFDFPQKKRGNNSAAGSTMLARNDDPNYLQRHSLGNPKMLDFSVVVCGQRLMELSSHAKRCCEGTAQSGGTIADLGAGCAQGIDLGVRCAF
jgi:hypothetical protein